MGQDQCPKTIDQAVTLLQDYRLPHGWKPPQPPPRRQDGVAFAQQAGKPRTTKYGATLKCFTCGGNNYSNKFPQEKEKMKGEEEAAEEDGTMNAMVIKEEPEEGKAPSHEFAFTHAVFGQN